MNKKTIDKIRKLVGPITLSQLQNVECAVTDIMGVFIPSLGQCEYAITTGHTHPAYSFVITFEPDSPLASKEITPGNDEYGFTAMSPGIPHEEQIEKFTRYVAILIEQVAFEKTWETYSSKPCGRFFWTPFTVPKTVMIPVKQFIAEFEINQIGAGAMLDSLGIIIAHTLIRAMLKMDVSVTGISSRFEIQRAIELMHAHFGEKLSIPFLAKKVNCSEVNFGRLFKQETGLGPNEYLIRIRIDKARRFLAQTQKNVTEIAFECGFSSSAYFSDTFKKHTGLTPVQYRRNLT